MPSEANKKVNRATLVIPKKNGSVLLAKKGRGFGKGKWVGFGGKVEPGETVEQANMREIIEETGVHMTNVRKIGLILFTFECEPELFLEVHLFDTDSSFEKMSLNDEYEGPPVWYPSESIPFENTWPDFKLWSSHFLAGQRFHARIHYGDFATIKRAEVQAVCLAHEIGKVLSIPPNTKFFKGHAMETLRLKKFK